MEPSAGIDDLVRRMKGLLAPLEAAGDPGRYFLATYLRTTRAVAAELRRGGFRDPAWVERWDVAFADLYLDAVEAAQAGRRPPEPWTPPAAPAPTPTPPAWPSSSTWPPPGSPT
jgi:Family of unknown function (DUF5995)